MPVGGLGAPASARLKRKLAGAPPRAGERGLCGRQRLALARQQAFELRKVTCARSLELRKVKGGCLVGKGAYAAQEKGRRGQEGGGVLRLGRATATDPRLEFHGR